MNILRDSNSISCPLVKDCLAAIKDPLLLDLPPVKQLGFEIHALPHVGAFRKKLES